MVVAIPSWAPDSNHCSLGTRMKSAILGSEGNVIYEYVSTDYIERALNCQMIYEVSRAFNLYHLVCEYITPWNASRSMPIVVQLIKKCLPSVSAIHPLLELAAIFSRNCKWRGMTSLFKDDLMVATVASSRQPKPNRSVKGLSVIVDMLSWKS